MSQYHTLCSLNAKGKPDTSENTTFAGRCHQKFKGYLRDYHKDVCKRDGCWTAHYIDLMFDLLGARISKHAA